MHIHNVDFHYHAGQERHPDKALFDYLEHARLTGRRVLGVTDHLNFFTNPRRIREEFPYEQTLTGLARYRDEVEEQKRNFPSLTLLFTPEIPSNMALDDVPDEAIEMSDGFICEYRFPRKSVAENTAAFVERIREIRAFVDRAGKPTFVAHPFRDAVNMRLVKQEIEPWVREIAPRPAADYSVDEVSRFFLLDMQRIGEASKAYDVPLEINGATDQRFRASNLPQTVHLLWAAYKHLQAAGARFVPGSDQHGFMRGKNGNRMGGYVPFETFDRLGLTVDDIDYINRILPKGWTADSA